MNVLHVDAGTEHGVRALCDNPQRGEAYVFRVQVPTGTTWYPAVPTCPACCLLLLEDDSEVYVLKYQKYHTNPMSMADE